MNEFGFSGFNSALEGIVDYMISPPESNGSNGGSDYMDTSMRGGGNGLDMQNLSPPGGAVPPLPSPRGGSRAKAAPLTKKLFSSISSITSISAQFRRLSSMGGSLFDSGKRNRNVSSSEDPTEEKVNQVVERVQALGYSEEICQELRSHFARLPARYALNIDTQRHEDVLLHMNIIWEAAKAEAAVKNCSNPPSSYPLPQVHVRKVQINSCVLWMDTCDRNGGDSLSKALPIPRIPKPAFGSNTNLAGLVGGSPKVYPSPGHSKSQSTPPSLKTLTSPSIPEEIPRPTFGHFVNPLEMDEDNDQEDAFGWEITLATSDRRGLLRIFTNALSTLAFDLNIKEAHVFSTSDGMALEVFVVEGWSGDEPEDLRNAVLEALEKELSLPVPRALNDNSQLKSAVEALAYEDWTVDFNNLEIGEKLGGGSSGRLHRGKYLSQEVAIKIIELTEVNMENDSGTLRSVPAVELLQMFKQEVSIMRLVRHKNLVQFIGACSCWPKLCIVTELMAGGSVRDMMESRGSGLDLPAAIKVLRDAARGMDFLHRRGIVHRDLKAANLLVDEHDVVKVCDFGVARVKPAVASNHGGGNWTVEMTAETGTYRWMSPEVLEHKPYDHKADVYSFGIMIWEVLTGEIPYAGLTPLQAAIGVVQRGLRPVMPPTVPPKLAGLAELCWHQDPDQRPEFNEAVTILEELMKPSFKRGLFGKMKFGSNHHLKSVDQQEVKTFKSNACKGRKKKNDQLWSMSEDEAEGWYFWESGPFSCERWCRILTIQYKYSTKRNASTNSRRAKKALTMKRILKE
ncbi:hypothetical protein R1flu_025223 [Riccia fluitans]|uniref:Protein kinase domain-containing protein n=1 Tax=Riccia fluitans TaxID=41844 RepID=A0ABD1Y044_9MARC